MAGERIEVLNQSVRSIVTLVLVGGFVFGYAFLKSISGEVYTAVVSGVIGYWFAARQGEQATKAVSDAALAAAAPKSINGVTEVKPTEPKP